MSNELSLRAYAKINWTLEVLGRRADGYHEIRTIMQTIGLFDTVRLSPADELSISVSGGTRGLRRHTREDPESNLAYRAAQLLKHLAGYDGGVSILLFKHIPVASGLGGGSSDAAAVLRGLRRLWSLDIDDAALAGIAAELGSDVPFFLSGGTALASGRGEEIEPLPDVPECELLVGWPSPSLRNDKTAGMYSKLSSEHFNDGSFSTQLLRRLPSGQPLRDSDLYNAFEAVLSDVSPNTARSFGHYAERGLPRPHLCGSGPAIYFLGGTGEDIWSLPGDNDLGLATMTNPKTVTAAEHVTVYEEQS